MPGDAEQAVFLTQVRLRRTDSGPLDFTGESVHGRKGGRFLYLTWGARPPAPADHPPADLRRLAGLPGNDPRHEGRRGRLLPRRPGRPPRRRGAAAPGGVRAQPRRHPRHGQGLQPPDRLPWLHTVEDIAGTNERDIKAEDGRGFFHWEPHFAHVFQGESGGFDLQVGNPPWVRPDWNDDVVLAEFKPWFKLAEKPSATIWRERKTDVLAQIGRRDSYLHDLAATIGTATYPSQSVTYPLIAGTRPDLYRAFTCATWAHAATSGTVGLIHPDSHFSGDKETRLRESAYQRLLVHGDFVNAATASSRHRSGDPVTSACTSTVRRARLDSTICRGCSPWTRCVRLDQDDGTAPDPGVRYGTTWDERPHRKRIIRVNEETLARWQRLNSDAQPWSRTVNHTAHPAYPYADTV